MIQEKTLVKRLAQIQESDLIDIRTAKNTYAAFRGERGFLPIYAPLLTDPQGNMKLNKTTERVAYGLSLAPHSLSGAANLCPFSTKGCRAVCIHFTGSGMYPRSQLGRKVKTEFLVAYPVEFLTILVHELELARGRDRVSGISMRMNVLSDIRWEDGVPWLFERFDDVVFYDYTKHPERPNLPNNYHITWSASERMTDQQILDLIDAGENVTVLTGKKSKGAPSSFYGRPVFNGDKSDYRPADPKGVVVWLAPKGKAQTAPKGGFVRTEEGFTYA